MFKKRRLVRDCCFRGLNRSLQTTTSSLQLRAATTHMRSSTARIAVREAAARSYGYVFLDEGTLVSGLELGSQRSEQRPAPTVLQLPGREEAPLQPMWRLPAA